MVYLDAAARSLIRPEAKDALSTYFKEVATGANPNGLHELAKHDANVLNESKKRIAHVLGQHIRPSELFFTSGGTEANNIAVLGIALGALKRDSKRDTVLFSAIEHASVVELQKPLEDLGFQVLRIPANNDGIVGPEALEKLLSDSVALVSIMAVNNELGTIQPISELAALTHTYGALFHSDAVQAFTHISFSDSNIDALSISAHKIGALEGTGALYLKSKTPFVPTRFGGEQEKGIRVGTQNVCGAYVFSKVAEQAQKQESIRSNKIKELRDILLFELKDSSISPTVNIDNVACIDSILSLHVPGVNKEMLLMTLDSFGYSISAGSACKAALPGPTETVLALGKGSAYAESVIRVSFDERISPHEMQEFAKTLKTVAKNIQDNGRYVCE